MVRGLLRTLTAALLGSLFISAANAEELIKHNYIIPGESLLLVPDRVETRSMLDFNADNTPAYAVEMLYEFPGTGPINWERLYFDLRSISRLGNVTYFSEHIHEYRKMFPEAYVMESSSSKKAIPDYDDDTDFADAEIFAFLEEVVLGSGKYRINYTLGRDSLQIRIQNTSNLRRSIKIVNKDDLYMNFLFFNDAAGQLKVYLYGAYTLQNKFIVLKALKYPHSTLAKRVYTIFAALIDGFHGADLAIDFPDYLRE